MASWVEDVRRGIGYLRIGTVVGGCTVAALPTTLGIPLPLTMALTKRFEREDFLRRLHRMVPWARFCRRHILRIDLEVIGKENLPKASRGHLYVCNHQSTIDVVVLMDALETGAFVAKEVVRHYPVLGACAYAAGSVLVDRNDNRSRLKALRETLLMSKRSTAVVVFPEGTRSMTGELQTEISPGVVRVAYSQRLKVLPVAIDGTHHVAPPSNDWYRWGQQVVVNIGQVMDPGDWPDSKTWSKAVWERVQELFAQGRQRLTA